jgi:hypothetical protein
VEFGRAAARAGFRTAYWPDMRLDHEHEADVRLFLAKKMAGGWVLERSSPARRRPGPLAAALRVARRRFVLRLLTRLTLLAGVATVAGSRVVGLRVAGQSLRLLTLVAMGVGRLAYRAGLQQAPAAAYLDGSFASGRRAR